jgi:peptide/nickel transport system permease protein
MMTVAGRTAGRTAGASAQPAGNRRVRRLPAPLAWGLSLLLVLVFVAALAPLLLPFEPTKLDMSNTLAPPGGAHWLGTDHLGRDVLTRVVYGARLSLLVGVLAVLPAALAGLAVGLAAGYLGSWIDETSMRVTDILLAFPILILAMGISVAMGRSLFNAVFAMTIVLWPSYTRLARAQTMAVRHRDFIEAAQAVGVGPGRVLRRHILPNCVDPIIVQASSDVGVAIIVVASLSFLGLGAQPPTPEWGAMILEGKLYMREAWWISTFPGFAMFAAVYTFTLLGDGLRDWMDRARR